VVWNARIRPRDPDAACTSAFSVSTAGEDYCVLNSDGTAQYTNRIREIASLWLLKEIIGQGKPQGLRLMGLLWQTLAFQGTDPRDKVFALVGLSHGVDPDFIDYKLNMHEVFIRGPGSSFVTTLRQLSRYCL
jgi:hypothetical protein